MAKTLFFKSVLLAGAASAILSTVALAADVEDVAVPAPIPESAWDVAFGVTITSDYIGRGLTMTDGGPAIQPWAEFTYGMFYAGYWGSNVVGDWESDLSIGIRPELGPVSFDLGHVWYVYGSSPTASEAYIKASVTPVEPFKIGGAFYYGTTGSVGATYTEVNAAVDLIENISASAAFGWIGGTASPYTTWNAGLTWKPVDPFSLDVRYHAGPTANKVVVSASISSSFKSLGLIH